MAKIGSLVIALTALGTSCAHAPNTAPPPPSVSRSLLEHHDLDGNLETRLYLIHYEPGVAAPLHHHPVEGLGYVVRGSFESAFEGEAPIVVRAGQSFRDRALVAHTLFRNADTSAPLDFVMTYVVPKDAPVVETP